MQGTFLRFPYAVTIEVCRCTRRRELTRLHFTSKWKGLSFAEHCYHKNHISTIVIGLKNSCFPLIHLLSYYQSVCYQTVQ